MTLTQGKSSALATTVAVSIPEPLETEVTNTVDSKLVDSSGNDIVSHADADGDYHLGTVFIQDILTSTNNSTTANLNAGATFTGTAEETFGINGIQVYHFADQDCTVYIDQSLDGTNWDIEDSFSCLANEACTRTFTSVAPYFRARITNNSSSATTTLRFATGMTPVISPLPRALTAMDRLKVESALIDDSTETKVRVTPLGDLKVTEPTRLIGTAFSGTTKDTNFWTETVTGTGSVAQAGEITLATGTTADSTAKYESVRKARKVTGTANQFRAVARNVQAPAANCTRRIGCYNGNEGFFFQFDGTTFGIGSRKGGSDTIVSNGSFNGNAGPTLNIGDATAFTRVVIEYTSLSANFFVNGVLIHTKRAETASLTNTLDLPVTMEIFNSNGEDTNYSYEILFATIIRLGKGVTNPTYKYINTNTTTVCKYGAGKLQRLIVNDNIGSVTIYDNTAASGTLISELDTAQGSEPAYTVEYDCPFNNGLTIVTTGGVEVTVIYE